MNINKKKVAIFFVSLLTIILIFFWITVSIVISDINTFFSSHEKVYSSDMVSANIEITESGYFSIKVKVYDYKHKFIEDNATVTLNDTEMRLSKVPNGYYGYWKYYYIDTITNPTLLKNTNQLVFHLEYKDKKIHLATVDIPQSVLQSDISYIKNKDGIDIIWKKLQILDKLDVRISAKTTNQKFASYTVSKKVEKNGNYTILFKDINNSILRVNSLFFTFSGQKNKKVDKQLIQEKSSLIYQRKYHQDILDF